MRSSYSRSEGMGWRAWLAITVGVVLVAMVIGFAVYGGRVQPVQHNVEQVLPNDRFPS